VDIKEIGLGGEGLVSFDSVYGSVMGYYEHSNKPSDAMRLEEYLSLLIE
jgi:hypothetical protein